MSTHATGLVPSVKMTSAKALIFFRIGKVIMVKINIVYEKNVVYFDQQMGASHAVCR